ncbi:MAG: hypothetical protein DMF04_06770 [Verrucomicrobia bacterium]|nr:MAG: hypothetical protein DMF04_06770 [Verrucomicrobiota bacterium]
MAKEQSSSTDTESDTEYLSTYIARIEEALERLEEQSVITSNDVPEIWLGSGDVKRRPILWRLYEHTMFYITTLAPGTIVETHQHNENVFRYVIDGAIVVRVEGKPPYRVSQGMWIAVRANTYYSLEARGTTLLSAYQYQCKVQ